MNVADGAHWSRRTTLLSGAGLLVVLVFFAYMANRTGQAQFEEAGRRLTAVESINLRLDGEMFPLMFELRTDFDDLTRLEGELHAAAAAFDAVVEDPESRLMGLVERKLELVEDFKSQQAVLRNSRAIAEQELETLQAGTVDSTHEGEHLLSTLERTFLEYMGRRDPISGAALREAVKTAAASAAPIVQRPEWRTLEAHLLALLRYSDQMGELMLAMFIVPLQQTLIGEEQRLGAAFQASSSLAARYRIGLLIVALMLLSFSVMKVLQARRYVQMIESANDALECRVADRTRELSAANSTLLREMTERESMEVQLRIAQKLESIGQLAAGVAHEINTPAQYVNDNVSFVATAWRDLALLFDDYERAVVHGDADAARSRAVWSRMDAAFLRKEVPAALAAAGSGLEQIGHIVGAMKEFSHPGGRGSQPADINRAIESTITVARNEWRYVAEVSLDLDRELPPVPCNVSAFNQVVLNLLVNAAQAVGTTRENGGLGRIGVSSRQVRGHVEVRVEDDGPGVPLEILDRIFDPFFTTKDVGQGTGQGLAIAYRVVSQHGGSLHVENGRGGRGACFVVRLPLSAAGTASESSPPRPAPALTA